MYKNLKSITIKHISLLTIIGLFIIGVLFNYTVQTTSKSAKNLTNKQEISPQTLNSKTTENEMPASLKKAVIKAQYKAERVDDKLIASNSANNMKAEFDETGLSLRSTAKNVDWQSTWHLKSIGYGDKQSEVKSGELISKDQRVEIKRKESDIVEWFENRPSGLEHGYTLAKRPVNADPTESLRLVMAVSGDLKAEANQNGQALTLRDSEGKEVLQYSKLKVWDAENKEQNAKMQVSDNEIFLEVEEADATYPLTIDPTFVETKKLTASDGAAGDNFGYSVSISGDTAVVGAFKDDDNSSNSGSAYIFEKNEGGADNWGEVAKLTAFDGAADDGFGFSASISGDTVIVSAVSDDDNGTNSGSAYIFERNEGGPNFWGQVAKLTPNGGAGGDNFGYSASISGDTVIVSAYLDDGGRGSAYIFERNEGGANNWGEVTKVVASDGVGGDQFGFSASISGDTAVVSAWLDDNVNGTNAGSGYIFERNEGGANNWGEVTKLTTLDGAFDDRLGYSASISSDSIVIGAYRDDPFGFESGSAYIFERNEGGANNWGEVTKLIASDGAANDQFGFGVSVLGDTVLIGARRDDNKGSAYIYKRNEGGPDNWGEVSKLIASDGIPGAGNAGPNFGLSVTLSSDTAIVSSFTNDEIGSDAGAAYVFEITPPNTAPTISSSGVSATQGNPSANLQIATVDDTEDDDDSLAVSIDGGTSAATNGVTVSGVAIAPDGTVTADVIAADCTSANANFTLEVTDSGGLSETATLSVTVLIETTPPVIDSISDIVITLPPNSTATSTIVSFPTPTATDNCDLTPTVTASPSSGSTFSVGETTVTVDAVDDAGNNATAVTFKVIVLHNFTGFFNPIDNLDINYVKAGRGIPVKFSLSGDKGLNIMAVGYPVSVETPCSGSGNDGAEIPTETAGNSSLSYSSGSDQYNYVWKTEKSWKATCRTLVVGLNDGTFHTANFKFK